MFVVVYRSGERATFDAAGAAETRTHVVLRLRTQDQRDPEVARVPIGELAWWRWRRQELDRG